jgi:uncharacterized protein
MSRGMIRRKDKAMSAPDVATLLGRLAVAHFGTVGPDGMPYVVPNLFVYAEGRIFLHTTSAAGSHLRRNVEHSTRVCFEAAELGQVFPYGRFECDTSASYRSVVGFGTIRIEEDAAAKARFFDRFLAKYGDPAWRRPAGFYPRLDEVTVYAIAPDEITGKEGALPPLGERWPARDATRSPDARPPAADPKSD